MTSEDRSWNPWLVKEVHPSDLLVDKFLSWDSNSAKPRLKAWHRAQKWVSDIIRLPFTPPNGHTLRVSDKENAFLFMTEEMSKDVSFTDFLRNCMIPPTNDLGLVSNATQSATDDTSKTQEAIKNDTKNESEKTEVAASKDSSNDRVGKLCKSTWKGTECQISDCSEVHIKPCHDRECYAQYDGLPLWKRRKCQLWHVRTESKKKKSNENSTAPRSKGNGASSFLKAAKNGHSNSHQLFRRNGRAAFPNDSKNGQSTFHSKRYGSNPNTNGHSSKNFRSAAENGHSNNGCWNNPDRRSTFRDVVANGCSGNGKAVTTYTPLIRGGVNQNWGQMKNPNLNLKMDQNQFQGKMTQQVNQSQVQSQVQMITKIVMEIMDRSH